jgi:hypothetical protein
MSSSVTPCSVLVLFAAGGFCVGVGEVSLGAGVSVFAVEEAGYAVRGYFFFAVWTMFGG